jgi:signal transduction histidine kinase
VGNNVIDLPTLAMATGIGNLAFAALATVYARSAPEPSPTLTLWRRARLVGGLALLVNGLRLPLWPGVVVSHVALFLAWALEYAAYRRLLGRPARPRGLILATAFAIGGRFALHLAGVPRSVDLLLFSLVNGSFVLAMAAILLAHRARGPLVLMMGLTNALGGSLFFIRVGFGLWVQPLVPFDPVLINVAMWTVGYLVVIVNGFGFLLVAKQENDEQLRQALAELAQAEAEQRQLLSLASHEFRTPAAMIQTSLDSLKFLAEEVPPQVETRLGNMRKATQRLIRLANSLIAQDRLRERRLGLSPGRVDLRALIDGVVSAYPEPIRWQPPEQPVLLDADPELLTIALHNLIDNALRHGRGEPPEIRLQVMMGAVELAVADLGEGVPDDLKSAVFERFYHRDGSPGSGIGLSIVLKIAHLHGGEAGVRDNPPHGAVFYLRLPLNVHPNA